MDAFGSYLTELGSPRGSRRRPGLKGQKFNGSNAEGLRFGVSSGCSCRRK